MKDCNLKVKLYLEEGNDKFMGIGVLWLLQAIEKEGSLRAAAQSMGISYSKAYSMLGNLEKALDCSMVERRKGGQNRSGICLTAFAKEFIVLYDNFQKEAKNLLDQPFRKFLQELNEKQQKAHFL